ncbi:MAG: hypothetical protein KC516_01175 [Nanoarchaeota archaeon]|nr:hypothetical protein [Nanoarchaeota archaeon]
MPKLENISEMECPILNEDRTDESTEKNEGPINYHLKVQIFENPFGYKLLACPEEKDYSCKLRNGNDCVYKKLLKD